MTSFYLFQSAEDGSLTVITEFGQSGIIADMIRFAAVSLRVIRTVNVHINPAVSRMPAVAVPAGNNTLVERNTPGAFA